MEFPPAFSPTYGDLFGGSGTAQTGFGFTGEQTDASGLVYLRARYYLPGLGVFPSLDPVEEGNRYGYVGGDVVNRVDPSGECWLNERANTLQQDYCHTQFLRYTQDISRQYGEAWSPELHKAIGDQARFWSQLEFEDFLYLWNNPDFNPPSDGSGLAAVLMYTQSATIPNPVAVLVGACTALGVIALLSATLPKRRGLADDIQDFLRYLRESLGRSIPIPIPRDLPIPTPTPTQRRCRGYFLPGNQAIYLPPTNRVISDGFRTTQEDVLSIMEIWLGEPSWVGSEGIYYSSGPCQDDSLTHSVRLTKRDLNASQPHINVEAGMWVPKGNTSSFDVSGRNLHIYM
ncbi:MAG: RHS repeat-associated core domain-containing protein [Anaerolinea sp.]|nr:RHS repeat-associated core domain-containing protein [Anaerolinea sp.]